MKPGLGHCYSRIFVFLRIQVHANGQTKRLERGWKRRARPGRNANGVRAAFRVTLFSLFGEHQGIIPPLPPYPTTIKHTTGITDNKKYSSHDSHWLSPERGTFFRFQVYQRIKISLIKVSERVGKSLTSVCKKTKKTNRRILWRCKSQENVLVLWFKGGTEQLGFWRGQH